MTAEELLKVLEGAFKRDGVTCSGELIEEDGFVGTYVEIDGESYYVKIQPI